LWGLVNITEFLMKKIQGNFSYMRSASHSVRALLHLICHTVLTNRQYITPATLAVSVVYR
jgi:hypothetical protein